jgi:caspase domain-containing protein
MSRFVSSRCRLWLASAGLAVALFGFAQGSALAQTRTAELDRIQAPPQALPAAEQRVALVIGNSKYQNTPPLANPDNDAQSVAELLNAAGFEVIAATDLSQNDMIKVVQDFSAKITERGPDTVAMIYYAGHGVQVAGENYLIPVDAKITSPTDLVDHSLRLVDLMATLESIPSRLRIVMLDSCRTNPFPNIVDDGRGLAMVDAPLHSIVGYSTAPGAEALDGANGHSPYTQAFLTLAREPNLPIEQLFKRIRLNVSYLTQGVQTPWESSSATSDFYFFGDTAVATGRMPENGPVVQMASDMPWRSVDKVYDYVLSEGSPAYYQEFIDRFPYDPRSDRFRHLLQDLTEAAAWHTAVLANSPLAYKSFYDHHVDGPYAKIALHLEQQPKGTVLMQASHLFKGNAGLRQMPLSTGAKVSILSVHGANASGAGKVVNLPANNKGAEHGIEHHEAEHHDAGRHEISHHESQPHEHFERRQTSFNRFSNSQARMGGMRGGGGMHFMGGGGGMHMMGGGGGSGGFGHHR